MVVGTLVGALLALAVLAAPAGAIPPAPADVVVVLPGAMPSHLQVQERIRAALASPALGRVQIHAEFLEESRFPGEDYGRLLYTFLRAKYAGRPVRLVFAVGPAALNFLLQHRTGLFPDVPIVFCGARPGDLDASALPPGVTGIWRPVSAGDTVEAALRLQPQADELVVIAGTTGSERAMLQDMGAALAPYGRRLRVRYLASHSMRDILEEVAALPPSAMVLYQSLNRDGAGETFVPGEALERIAGVSSVPIYGLFEPYLGHGMVGGRVIDLVDLGAQAGDLGRQILAAGSGAALPPPRTGRSTFVFDWRQLQRWSLDEGRLPVGSTVAFRGLTFWQQYGTDIVLFVVTLFESGLIVVLWLQWRRRRRAEASLTERLRLEEVLSGLYARFALLQEADVEAESERSLAAVGEFLGVDRAKLVAPSEKTGFFVVGGWARPGVDPGPAVVSLLRFPWTAARLQQGEVVKFSRLAELPPEAAVDRKTYQSIGACSHVSIPLVADDLVVGSISFTTVLGGRSWPDELIERLRLLAGVLANVLARRRADEALRESRALSGAIVESLPGMVVVIDRAGLVIATNHWRRAAAAGHEAELSIGTNYLDVWRARLGAGDPAAPQVLGGIQSVLDGTSPELVLEHHTPPADGRPAEWCEIRGHPLQTASGGAVISRIDISERKRAAAETRRVRDELARVGRVATAGQLTAALAHEVKQPLTGILTNAQAARRFLAAPRPDLDEIRTILDDIIEDDQRAAGVIQRLRAMLKRHEPEPTAIDVNRLIDDVVRFLRTDAVIRNACVCTELEGELPTIRGDVVQLQQVLVNLALNGLDAMRDVPTSHRRLLITTRRAGDAVCVGVRDSGPGLAPESVERIFEPFFSSKPEGMGMGLPIARSIVDAHGGRLWVVNNADRGATFFFTLTLTGPGLDASPLEPATGSGRRWSAPTP
jgi:two-component system, LuxR family, sensor kinase FixL